MFLQVPLVTFDGEMTLNRFLMLSYEMKCKIIKNLDDQIIIF